MKALVTYYSNSGNTEKVAKGLFEGLKAKEKAIVKVEDVESVEEYDVIFCGFPVIEHSVPAKVQSFIKSIPAGSKVAFFATHGVHREGIKAKTAFETAGALLKSSTNLGTFGVRGKVEDDVMESLGKRLEHQSWVEEAASAANHPNEEDLKDAADFANKMLEKVKNAS